MRKGSGWSCIRTPASWSSGLPAHFTGVNPFMPTVPTFAVRETYVSNNGGAAGAPLKPLRDDSALRALSTLSTLKPLRDDSALRALSTQRGV